MNQIHRPVMGETFHELANLFPLLHGDALICLQNDIQEYGVREPVVFFEGAILDGRNRYRCALDLGIEYPRVEFQGEDPLAFVVSHNLHRRHLTESQRAMVAGKIANMRHGGDRKSDQAANLPLVSSAAAADMLNVSERSVRTAKKVQDDAPQEIIDAVDDGRLSVSLASRVAGLPDEARADVISAAPEETREVARSVVRKAFVTNNSGNNEWYTPEKYIEAARTVLGGFDLDPASSEVANQTVGAAQIYTIDDDGLTREWPVGRIWMNPPYAQPLMGQFSAKYVEEINKGSTGIVLVNNATETAWFQNIANVSSAICFPKARIRFINPDGESGAPLQGQAILYAGKSPDSFQREFSQFGLILQHG